MLEPRATPRSCTTPTRVSLSNRWIEYRAVHHRRRHDWSHLAAAASKASHRLIGAIRQEVDHEHLARTDPNLPNAAPASIRNTSSAGRRSPGGSNLLPSLHGRKGQSAGRELRRCRRHLPGPEQRAGAGGARAGGSSLDGHIGSAVSEATQPGRCPNPARRREFARSTPNFRTLRFNTSTSRSTRGSNPTRMLE